MKRFVDSRLLPSRSLLPMVLAVVLSTCALALGGGGCASGIAPDLTGHTWDEAESLAGKAGLQLVKRDEMPCFLPAGTVLAQDPLPGIEPTDGTIQVTACREPIPVQIKRLQSSDPDGNPKAENDAQIPNLTDGDLNTSWSTERYVSPIFANLGAKRGVGLAFTLAEGATMAKISYTLTGWKGEVQKLTSGLPPVAVAQLGDAQQVTWTEPLASGRIWFYQLAPMPDGDRNGVTINEIGFYK